MAKKAADDQKVVSEIAGGQQTNKVEDLVTVNVFLLHEDRQVSINMSPFARVGRVKTAIERAHGLKHSQQTLVYRSLPRHHTKTNLPSFGA